MKRIPTAIPNIGDLEGDYLARCIQDEMVSTVGPFVSEFEQAITKASGARFACATSTGTAALHAALVDFGVGHGDLVLVPSLTFIATANAIRHSGAHPYLVDINASDWTLDAALCKKILEAETDPAENGRLHRESGKIVRAIMPVLVMGMPIDFDGFAALGRDFDMPVIVDAAAGLGTTWAGKPIGNAPVDAFCFSFNGNKIITTGGGGAIICNNEQREKSLKHLTTTARNGPDYDHDRVGFNYRMTNVQAAIGVAQMERLDAFINAKSRISAVYSAVSEDYSALKPFPSSAHGQGSHWFSGFWYCGDDPAVADAFRKHMDKASIDVRKFWKPVHRQTPYIDEIKTLMPNADNIWWRIFPLPSSTNLSDGEITYIIKQCRCFWDGQA